MTTSQITYTKTDESPALASYSLLPLINLFTPTAGITLETSDISLAGRIIAQFPEYLTPTQRIDDGLAKLGNSALTAEANIIKLPNISASIPQLKATIKELQQKGYSLPNYPETANSDQEKLIKERYDKIKGSAVNPVLREGNSDRRAPTSVKAYVRQNPHSMGSWKKDSLTHVASMDQGDFYGTEQSITIDSPTTVSIELETTEGEKRLLKSGLEIAEGEIIDTAVMRVAQLDAFIREQIIQAKEHGVLLSLHLKATMMKVSDPIIFGRVLKVFFQTVFDKYQAIFERIGVNPNNGLGDIYVKLESLEQETREAIIKEIETTLAEGPDLAMVDSENAITNLHVPSDVIVDASMPAMIRSSGKMWNAKGKLQDTKAIIPDRCYSGIYQQTIDFCKRHGAFDPTTMGTVPNIGLMAKKAEEYGSHDKTFEVPAAGVMRVISAQGQNLLEHKVQQGDIWRMCQTKDLAIKDWVALAVKRSKLSQTPAIFWLDEQRAHDVQLIEKVTRYLDQDVANQLGIEILSPEKAVNKTLERIKAGLDTISVTGNVLRDYLTDLFPILELGTSAKMLSIVPLLNGGGLFETGAGGSAPKLVQQFLSTNHLIWDSLGEYLALSASLEHLSETQNNPKARILAKTLEQATEQFLKNDRSPSLQIDGLDSRGSHFYLCLYWAQALAQQDEESELKDHFTSLAEQLIAEEHTIIEELQHAKKEPVELGGYYSFDEQKVNAVMRPSKTLNRIIQQFTV